MTRLGEAYQRLGEGAPVVGDIERAIGTHRRRRRVVLAGVPVLSVLLVVGSLLVTTMLAGRPEREPAASAPAFSIDGWARPTSSTNNGAEVGTMLSKECAEVCDFYLRRADGKQVKLSQVRPDLVKLLSKNGFGLTSLSYDARWLGVTVGRQYEIHRLTDPSQVITLPAGPAGSEWRVIDWGRASQEVALGLYQDGWVRRYALVSLVGDERVDTYVPAKHLEYDLPVRLEGRGVVIGSPAVTQKGPSETELSSDVLNLTGPDQGKLTKWWDGTTRPDVGRLMSPDETLTGPRGVEVSSCPPVDGTPMCSTVVWSRKSGDVGRAIGVIKGWTSSDGIRFDVPDGDEWIYTGMLPIDAIAVRHDRTIRPDELVAIHADGRQQVIATLEKDAMILLPGMTAPS